MSQANTEAQKLAAETKTAFSALLAQLQKTTPKGHKPTLPAPAQSDLYRCAMYLHAKLEALKVPYYFCGGFACINVGMTARTTADIDIAVPNGNHGFGSLLGIMSQPPCIQDKSGVLPKDSYFFYVQSSHKFVEVDGIIAGFMAFPAVEHAGIVQTQPMQLKFLEPASLLKLKLSSWANKTRREGPKRAGDISDITSIRDLLIKNHKTMDLKGLKSDMQSGLKDWVGEFKDLKEWQKLDKNLKI